MSPTRGHAWGPLVGLLLLTMLVTSLPGGATALTLVEETRMEDGSRVVRVALDQGTPTQESLDGEVRLNGTTVPEERTPIPQEPVPWRGFPATLQLELSGNGTLLLADGASGLAFGVGHGDGEEDPAAGSGEPGPADGNRSLVTDPPGNGTGAPGNASPTSSPEGTAAPEPTDLPSDQSPLQSSGPDTGGDSLPWRWIALGVGVLLAIGALVVETSQAVRLRIAQVGWFLGRVWDQRRKR